MCHVLTRKEKGVMNRNFFLCRTCVVYSTRTRFICRAGVVY